MSTSWKTGDLLHLLRHLCSTGGGFVAANCSKFKRSPPRKCMLSIGNSEIGRRLEQKIGKLLYFQWIVLSTCNQVNAYTEKSLAENHLQSSPADHVGKKCLEKVRFWREWFSNVITSWAYEIQSRGFHMLKGPSLSRIHPEYILIQPLWFFGRTCPVSWMQSPEYKVLNWFFENPNL